MIKPLKNYCLLKKEKIEKETKFGETSYKENDEEYLLIKDEDILAVIE